MFSRFTRLVLTLAAVSVLAFATAGALQAQPLSEEFFGSYVGSGTAQNVIDKTSEKRDLDVSVVAYKNNGFTMKWITVVRDSKGSRTGEGVKRREVEENFLPLEGRENVYVLAPKGGLFKRAELPNPLRGEPMRWASVEDKSITVYSIAIDDNGKSEMQVYRRTLSDKGMDVSYLRMLDENIVVTLKGTLARTK